MRTYLLEVSVFVAGFVIMVLEIVGALLDKTF